MMLLLLMVFTKLQYNWSRGKFPVDLLQL